MLSRPVDRRRSARPSPTSSSPAKRTIATFDPVIARTDEPLAVDELPEPPPDVAFEPLETDAERTPDPIVGSLEFAEEEPAEDDVVLPAGLLALVLVPATEAGALPLETGCPLPA